MPAFAVVLVCAAICVAAILLLSFWGLPFVLLAAVVLAVYLMAGRRRDPSLGTVESGGSTEPTGRPRKATGGAHPTNERVGG